MDLIGLTGIHMEYLKNLRNDNKITKTLITQRIAAGKHYAPYGQVKSFSDLLLKIEYEFFNIIVAMSKFRHPIRVSNKIQLINDLI